jgi:hypothetical protein
MPSKRQPTNRPRQPTKRQRKEVAVVDESNEITLNATDKPIDELLDDVVSTEGEVVTEMLGFLSHTH